MQTIGFYVVCVSFLIGIAISSLFDGFSIHVVMTGLCVGIVLCLFGFFFRNKTPIIFLAGLCVVSLYVGVARHSYVFARPVNQFLQTHVDRDVEFFALVVDEPDIRENGMRLTVLPYDLETERTIDKDAILVTTGLYSDVGDVAYGDVLSLVGVLQLPENFETDTGRMFDYVSYLKKSGVRFLMKDPQVHIESRGKGNMFKRTVLRIKAVFIENISRVIPQPHSSLAGGILLGAKNALSKDVQLEFRQAGLIHVVVLSGYNVTVVADFIVRILSFLPKMIAGVGGVVGIIFFAVITGAGATVVRASTMALLVLVARHTGRTYDVLRALALASCAMVMHNPYILLSDPSFQLSCMATYALIMIEPIVEPYLRWLPETFQIRSCTASTLATQLFLLPTLIYMTGMVSIVSLVTNILVVSVVPLAMLVSFVTGLLGFVSVFMSSLVGYVSYGLLQYMFFVVSWSIKIPFAYVMLPAIPLWGAVVMYVFLFWLLWKKIAIKKLTENRTIFGAAP